MMGRHTTWLARAPWVYRLEGLREDALGRLWNPRGASKQSMATNQAVEHAHSDLWWPGRASVYQTVQFKVCSVATGNICLT